jgi:hypothetical protein
MSPTYDFCPVCSDTLKMKICKTIVVSVCIGMKSGHFALREERNLQVFENEVPRKIFGLKKTEVSEKRRIRRDLVTICRSPGVAVVTSRRGCSQ